MDAGVVIAIITSAGAFATAATGTIVAGVRGSKVDRRSLALQELEASLKHRAEDMNSTLERLKAMEERVDELDGQLEVTEKEKWKLRRENNDLVGRVSAVENLRRENRELVDRVSVLEQEVSQLELDKAALQRDVDVLRSDLQRLTNGPRHD